MAKMKMLCRLALNTAARRLLSSAKLDRILKLRRICVPAMAGTRILPPPDPVILNLRNGEAFAIRTSSHWRATKYVCYAIHHVFDIMKHCASTAV